MAAQTAQIIDLEEHRRARRAEIAPDRTYEPRFLAPSMVMVPVWFVPTFFIGNRFNWG